MSGCVADYPQDIAIVSIKVVDNREQAELPAPPMPGSIKAVDPYRDFLFSLSDEKGVEPITPADIEVYFRNQESNQSFKNAKQQKPLLKVTFQSKENLSNYIRSKSYTLSVVPFFCDRPDVSIRWGSPYVYWRGLNVSAPLNYAVKSGDNDMFTYYAYLNAVDDFSGPSSYQKFDLRKNPEDICVQLKGGSMGMGFQSNVVEISKEEVISVLKELPSTLR
jgi:hypothetical protein